MRILAILFGVNKSLDAVKAAEEDLERKKKSLRDFAKATSVLSSSGSSRIPNISQQKSTSLKEQKNLARLRSLCQSVPLPPPSDPARAKLWNAWRKREASAILYKKNFKSLNVSLLRCKLRLDTTAGSHSLLPLLSVRDCSSEMVELVRCAVEIEAGFPSRSSSAAGHSAPSFADECEGVSLISLPSIEGALAAVCQLAAAPGSTTGISFSGKLSRTKEEIASLASDKHEKALISNVVSSGDIGVTYDMIGGLTEVKELLRESITYPLKFPHLYSEGIAGEAVKGLLLFGPPGTGKTMLAKAVATEGGANFLNIDASSVENKWLGESEKNAKAVFTLARKLAPCVIFLDEVDSLLSSREQGDDSSHGTLTSVKTTMMAEWDGLSTGGDRIVVIGSTNRPCDLDEAVLRRFPRRVLVDLPDLKTRTEILEVTMQNNRVEPSLNFTQVAEKLEGYTGSDLKEVCREAVVQISHEQASLLDKGKVASFSRLREVKRSDFDQALTKLKKSVAQKGRELGKVYDWNDNYGEIKKKKKKSEQGVSALFL